MIDGDVRTIPGQRPRAVLAYLVLNAGRRVGVDQLIDALWGDHTPKTARNSVQRFVSDIRRAIAPFGSRLESVVDGYRLSASADESDVFLAEAALGAGRAALAAGDPSSAAGEYQRGLGLWLGQALSGVGDAYFAAGEITRLEEMRMTAVEESIDAELALGRHHEVIPVAERFALAQPTRERAWSLLMRARYRCGRPKDALAAFDQLRTSLREAGGLEPSSALQDLRQQIRMRSPELDAPAPRVSSKRSGGPPRATLESPLPRPLERSSRFPMVGRSTQMVQINALQDTLERGEPAVVFVEGEAGIGKTRLAAELALQFHREGTSVLYGRCEEGLTEPYQPWIDIFDQIVRGAPDGMIARSVGMGGTGKVP